MKKNNVSLRTHVTRRQRPITDSLSRFGSALAIAAAISGAAHSANINWDGGGSDNLWSNPLNWDFAGSDVLPTSTDIAIFPSGSSIFVHPNASQSVDSLTFNENTIIGALGNTSVVSVVGTGASNINIASSKLAQFNSILTGTNINVAGGGSLYLSNINNSWSGALQVDGAGTSVIVNPMGALQVQSRTLSGQLGQYTGTGRTVRLQNGGELKIIGSGWNPDGVSNAIILNAGDGALNVAAAYQTAVLDDGSQISGAGRLVKNGNGILQISSQDYRLAGGALVNQGVLRLNRNTANLITSFATNSTVTVGDGTGTRSAHLVMDTGGNVHLDNNVVLNIGGIISAQGAEGQIGLMSNTAPPTLGATQTMTVNGGTLLLRDGFGQQTARHLRINSVVSGSGTVDVLGSTIPGGNNRLILQRPNGQSTFSGTWKLGNYGMLEANPRYSSTTFGSGTITGSLGNALGATSTIELAGIGALFDVRDGQANNTLLNSGVSNYTGNNVIVSNTQNGNLPTIVANPTVNSGSYFNFNNLTVGSQRLLVQGGSSMGFLFNNLVPTASAVWFDASSAPIGFANAVNESGSFDTIRKTGSGAIRAISAINVSNVNLEVGSIELLGANGAINTGSLSGTGQITLDGALAWNGTTNAALLHASGAATLPGTAAANNNNRLNDSVAISTYGNPTIRLTSFSNTGTTETTGNLTLNGGQVNFDVIKTGTATAPVTFTLGTAALALNGNATANFTGGGVTVLGVAGVNTTRIILPTQATTAFLGPWATSGNEWVRYDTTVDSGQQLGVIPFVAANYTLATGNAVGTWNNTHHIKLDTAAVTTTLPADTNVLSLNLQQTAAGTFAVPSIALNGFTLTTESGGILQSTQNAFITGAGAITAGATASPASLYLNPTGTLVIQSSINDNLATGVVTLVHSGTGTTSLRHPSDTGTQGTTNFGAGTTNGFTGGIVMNNGTLEVRKLAYLGTGPIVLNGGTINLNVPSTTLGAVQAAGNNVIVNGNAIFGWDDNGELTDAASPDHNIIDFGSLTITRQTNLGIGGYNTDVRFTGATFTGTPTINLGQNRDGSTVTIVHGAQSGSGFDVVAYGAAGGVYQFGSGDLSLDNTANTYSGVIRAQFGGNLRLAKQNGANAIPNSATGEDLIINGGGVFLGSQAISTLNTYANGQQLFNGNGVFFATSAGHNQIADDAEVTMLNGTLFENNRLNDERIGTLTMRNGTLNVGLGDNNADGLGTKLEIDNFVVSGGTINTNSGGYFKTGTATFQPGAPELTVNNGSFVGLTTKTTYEVGSGGLTLAGQGIFFNNNALTGSSGTTLKLGGNVTVNYDPLWISSAQRGLFLNQGNNGHRELGNNSVDLLGGVRTFTIDPNVSYRVQVRLENGGFTLAGGGILAMENFTPNTFAGAVNVNDGVYYARSTTPFGTSAGGVNVAAGGTIKSEQVLTVSDDVALSGLGAIIPGSGSTIREEGAFVQWNGLTNFNGAFSISGATAISSAQPQHFGISPGATPTLYSVSRININAAGGVTGTGDLTVTGGSDTAIANGVNTIGNLSKSGNGTLYLDGAGTLTGTTEIAAGVLQISNGSALGATGSGTTIIGGGTLALAGGITINEPITAHGAGAFDGRGAIDNVSGVNTVSATVTNGYNPVYRSSNGTLHLNGGLVGDANMILTGAGNGSVGDIAAEGGLTKQGSGVWTLKGDNSGFVGPTSIAGGTLVLDFTTDTNTKLDSGASLTLQGGNLTVLDDTQVVNGATLGAGGGVINLGAGAGLTLGTITRAAGSTLNVIGAGASTSSTNNAAGILGGYATHGGNSFATVSGGSIGAYAGYVPLSGAGATSVVDVTAGTKLGGGVSVDSIRVAGLGIAGGTNTISLAAGGAILATGGGTVGLNGGLISGPTTNDELVLHVNSGTDLAVANGLIGAGTGQLTKGGAGSLTLFGSNTFTGAVNVNEGTLRVFNAANFGSGTKNVNLNNGSTLEILGDYDVVASTNQINIGSGGAKIRTVNGNLTLNDASQFGGSGDLTKLGGGYITFGSTNIGSPNYRGNVDVQEGGLVLVSAWGLGNVPTNIINLRSGTFLVNNAPVNATAPAHNGSVRNTIFADNSAIYVGAGGRQFQGDVTFSGTNILSGIRFDSPVTTGTAGGYDVNNSNIMQFAGRVLGSGTLNILGNNGAGYNNGAQNGSPVTFSGGSNTFNGTINITQNAGLELRGPGSIAAGTATAATVNLTGANARLLLRNQYDGDYNLNLNIPNSVLTDVSVAQVSSHGLGNSQFLSVNNLNIGTNTTANNHYLFITGGNGYSVRVKGTSTVYGSPRFDVRQANLVFDNGISYQTAGAELIKTGPQNLTIMGAVNNSGPVTLLQGNTILRGNGAITNASSVNIRGGLLLLDNGEIANANRLGNSDINLAGGTLRIAGATTFGGNVTGKAGHTVIDYSMDTQTANTALTLTGWTRETGSYVNFTSQFGTIGALNNINAQPRIFIPGQADTLGGTTAAPGGGIGTFTILPWATGSSNEFVAYSTVGLDGSNNSTRGVVQLNNNSYELNTAEGSLSGTKIHRFDGTATTTLTAARSVYALKMDGGTTRTLSLNANSPLTIVSGAVIHVNNEQLITAGTNAGAFITAGTLNNPSELQYTVNAGIARILAPIQNNGTGALTLVKNGAGTLRLETLGAGAAAHNYSGGIYVNQGVLHTYRAANIPAANAINLNGGTFEANVNIAGTGNALNQDIVFGHDINVLANSTLGADNNGDGGTNNATLTIDNNIVFNQLSINGPYTLGIGGFDGYDFQFTGGANFSGQPRIDVGIGRDAASFTSITGNITGSSGFDLITLAANPGFLQLGNPAGTDNVSSTYTGTVRIFSGILELNKATGTTAITGDLEINGGHLRYGSATVAPTAATLNDQIANTSNIVLNNGSILFNGRNEAIASLTVNGGAIATGASAGARPGIQISGDFTVNEVSAQTYVANNASGTNNDGVQINSDSIISVGGTTTVGQLGKIILGASNANLDINALVFNGGMIQQNSGGGANTIRLGGDVTSNAATTHARLGNSTDSDTFLDLTRTGTGAQDRAFNVADGGAGNDLVVATVIRNGTSSAARLVKNGAGVLQLEGGGTANTYSGGTLVNEGSLVLFRNPGVNSAGTGPVTVGDGTGGAKADKLIVRSNEQIANTAALTVASSGVLDLATYNTNESVESLSGSGAVDLGPNSAFTVSGTTNTVFSGTLTGVGAATGAFIKGGASTLELSGLNNVVIGDTNINGGTLRVSGSLTGGVINVNTGGTLGGTGTVGTVVVNTGGIVNPGASPGTLNTGDYSQAAGTLQIELDTPPAAYDVLNVTGSVTLGGSLSLLNTSAVASGFVDGSIYNYWIIRNDGADSVSGTFAGLAEGSFFQQDGLGFTIHYGADFAGNTTTGGNDVLLVVPEPGSLASLIGGFGMLLGLQRVRRRRNI